MAGGGTQNETRRLEDLTRGGVHRVKTERSGKAALNAGENVGFVQMGEEHRRFARRRALKGGRIVFNHGRSTINCMIRDLSPNGARLEVASTVGIEDEFTLAFDDGSPLRHCVVRRRSGTSVGVEFVSEREPPQPGGS